MKLYKKNLLKQNYLFHRNLQFQKFIKTSPSVGMRIKLRDEDQTHMPPAYLFPQPPHSGWGNTTQYTQYTLDNSNLHQPLISFLYMIPSCK